MCSYSNSIKIQNSKLNTSTPYFSPGFSYKHPVEYNLNNENISKIDEMGNTPVAGNPGPIPL